MKTERSTVEPFISPLRGDLLQTGKTHNNNLSLMPMGLSPPYVRANEALN
jgi:hypothetical protein